MSGAGAPYAIGLDLGGTKIAAGVLARDGRVLAGTVRPTPVAGGSDAVLEALAAVARKVVEEAGVAAAEVAGVGLATPGPIDQEAGVVVFAPNLGWRDVPAGRLLSDRLSWPCTLVNDANAAALGETAFGAGRGASLVLYLTVSTGIGGGIVENGRLFTGVHGAAAEFGHQVIDPEGPRCSCGRRGCLEAFASGTAMARRAAERLRTGEASLLSQLAEGHPAVTAVMIGEAAEHGDRLAEELVAETARYLGVGLANLVTLFDPDRVVVGGGVAKLGERLLGPARELVRREALVPAGERVEIVPAALGSYSGVAGAARLAWDSGGSGA